MDGPHPVRPEQFDSLMDLLNSVFSAHQGRMRESFPLLFDYRNWANLFVMSDGPRVVSHVGMRLDNVIILGCRVRVAAIGAVATYDEFRGQGHASACLDAAQAKAVSDGASIMYISGSRGLYGRFGATKVGRAFVYAFQPADAPAGLSVREAVQDDIFDLERLYETEPVRFHRPLEDWRAAFAAAKARYSTGFQDYLFVATDSDKPTAYVVARRSFYDDPPRVYVTEYAGLRPHIVAAVPAVAAALDAPSIDFAVPDFDPVLLRAAAASGVAPRTGHLLGHTVKICCLQSFISALKPLIEERLGSTGAGGLAFQPGAGATYDVIIGEDHFPFPVSAFTTLAFGCPNPDDSGAAAFGQGLLGRLFPVPLPLPGLNYV